MVERSVRDAEAAGSNPVTPINKKSHPWVAFLFIAVHFPIAVVSIISVTKEPFDKRLMEHGIIRDDKLCFRRIELQCRFRRKPYQLDKAFGTPFPCGKKQFNKKGILRLLTMDKQQSVHFFIRLW